VTISHLEITIIIKKEETVTGQVKRQGNAWTIFRLIWNCTQGIIPEEVTVNKHRYKEILRHLCNPIHHKDSELWRRKSWLLLDENTPAHCSVHVQGELQNNRLPFCHTLHTHLISNHEISFSFPAWKKSYVGIDFSRLRRSSLTQGKPYGTFVQVSFSSASSNYTNGGRLA
jgi:hypothetical protein